MKSDSERQTAYQKRRAETEVRVAFWMGKDMDAMIERLRGDEARSEWLNRAVTELIYRQLSGKRFGQLYTADEHKAAVAKGREMGVNFGR